ncbi:MAG: hypothetical protein R3F39_25530 [Myxococcota bacterium]
MSAEAETLDSANTRPKFLEVVPIPPPAPELRAQRLAVPAAPGEHANRYTLPRGLDSASPVGFRTRVALTSAEARQLMPLLSLERPTAFGPATPVTEAELFEEASLGVLSSRQSTNFRGQRATVLGPADSREAAALLAGLKDLAAPALPGATHTWLILARPYRTAFTMLLTLIGHRRHRSVPGVAARLFRKRVLHGDDIPTIGYLKDLHLGILADGMERAALVASAGRRRAQVHMAPFCGPARVANRAAIRALEALAGLTARDRAKGWHLAQVVQVGAALPDERVTLPAPLWRKLGANLMAFRSERILPGVNQEPKAPAAYQTDQQMDVPDELPVMAGRAAFNAFSHWTGCDREHGKDLLLLERIDVNTPTGTERIGQLSDMLSSVTDRVIANIPAWADLPTGRAFSRNAGRGRKAFALVGQRVYASGLSQPELAAAGLDWERGVRAVGAAASRSALYVELMGVTDLPADCDLLAGICLMAGPVNQNDIGKTFYGYDDLLEPAFPGRQPTSLLVWTLKAKTVTDPIGNEEQLLNAAQKGALVDLRVGPHDVMTIRRDGKLRPFRQRNGHTSTERAFADVGNLVTAPDGQEIPGNAGEPWPAIWRREQVWPS